MKTWGKAFWKKVFEKRDEDGFSDITLDELAEVFAHDEEALVSAHADSKGNIRTVLRHLLFHLRFALLFAREERKKLEKRVRELETSVPSYRGSWKQRTPYARGSIVAYSGSMWHSNEDANEDKPGAYEAWTLCCKHGRDARSPVKGEAE
jgi:hypothetical protein